MDETQMIENKTLVDKLYSLRAGLSLVAVKNDEIKKVEGSKANDERERFFERDLLNDKKSSCLKRKQEIKDQMIQANETVREDIDYLKRQLKFGARLKRVFEMQIAVLASGDEVRAFLLYFIGIWLAIITFPIFAIIDAFVSGKVQRKLKKLNNELETYEQIMKKLDNNKEYIELTKEIEELEVQIAECDLKEKVFNEDKKKRIETKEQIIKETCDYSKALYVALTNEYSSTLDQRDWSNIDLIIYNIETGRADTLKEALQQVDNYRNTEKIVGAIRMATQAICNTISMEQDRMIRLVNNCADAVNSRLNTIDSNVKYLIKNDEMQYAMQRKANLTSEELVKEVKQLREKII